MSIELVKQLNQAFERKDKTAFRALLHEGYTFRGSLMEMSSPDEATEMLENCPMKAGFQNSEFIVSGDKIVQTFDWVVTEPFQDTIPMCDVITLKDGKIFREDLFYDSARFPADVLENMKAAMSG